MRVERQEQLRQKALTEVILFFHLLPLLEAAQVALVTGTFFLQEPLEVQVVQAAAQAALQVVTPLLAVQGLLGKALLVAEVMQAETVVAEVGLLPLVVLRLTMYPVALVVLVRHQASLAHP